MKESSSLIADDLYTDPRILQAKQLIMEAVTDHQKKIQHIAPPKEFLKAYSNHLLAEYEELRGGKLWYPFVGSGIGNGCLVELTDGSIKYDLISGIGVHYLGHSSPLLIESSIDAAISDTVMQGNLQQNRDSIELARMLIERSHMDHCFFSSSGVMANENALKLAFQKKSPAYRLLAFEHAFAGRTWALSQITDKPAFREGLPANVFVDYVPFYDPEHPEESTAKALEVLKTHLKRYPNQYAAMLIEFVQGEGGIYPGSTAFFTPLFNLLKEAGVTIIADEIQTFGRTPRLFAFQHFGLDSYIDIATIGKLSHVCATLFTKEFKPRAGLLSQTFTSSTTAVQASLKILTELFEGSYFGAEGKIMQIQEHFFKNFSAIEKKSPDLIKGPYGIGTMIAFTPFDGDSQRTAHFAQALFKAGVMSFIAGTNPTRIRFLIPAGAIKPHEIDIVTSIIEHTLIQEKE